MTQVMEPKMIREISIPEISKKVSLAKILVTTDFSPEADRAIDYALALARRYDARIYLAHVLAPDPFLYAEPALAEATYEKVRELAAAEFANAGEVAVVAGDDERGRFHALLVQPADELDAGHMRHRQVGDQRGEAPGRGRHRGQRGAGIM